MINDPRKLLDKIAKNEIGFAYAIGVASSDGSTDLVLRLFDLLEKDRLKKNSTYFDTCYFRAIERSANKKHRDLLGKVINRGAFENSTRVKILGVARSGDLNSLSEILNEAISKLINDVSKQKINLDQFKDKFLIYWKSAIAGYSASEKMVFRQSEIVIENFYRILPDIPSINHEDYIDTLGEIYEELKEELKEPCACLNLAANTYAFFGDSTMLSFLINKGANIGFAILGAKDGKFDYIAEALEHYQYVVINIPQLKPKDPINWTAEECIKIGNYLNGKDDRRSVYFFENSLNSDPQNAKVHYTLGELYRSLKKYDMASKHLLIAKNKNYFNADKLYDDVEEDIKISTAISQLLKNTNLDENTKSFIKEKESQFLFILKENYSEKPSAIIDCMHKGHAFRRFINECKLENNFSDFFDSRKNEELVIALAQKMKCAVDQSRTESLPDLIEVAQIFFFKKTQDELMNLLLAKVDGQSVIKILLECLDKPNQINSPGVLELKCYIKDILFEINEATISPDMMSIFMTHHEKLKEIIFDEIKSKQGRGQKEIIAPQTLIGQLIDKDINSGFMSFFSRKTKTLREKINDLMKVDHSLKSEPINQAGVFADHGPVMGAIVPESQLENKKSVDDLFQNAEQESKYKEQVNEISIKKEDAHHTGLVMGTVVRSQEASDISEEQLIKQIEGAIKALSDQRFQFLGGDYRVAKKNVLEAAVAVLKKQADQESIGNFVEAILNNPGYTHQFVARTESKTVALVREVIQFYPAIREELNNKYKELESKRSSRQAQGFFDRFRANFSQEKSKQDALMKLISETVVPGHQLPAKAQGVSEDVGQSDNKKMRI